MIQILECTLRDGSYSIDFQFTPEDTVIVAAALEDAGFRLIEIGHGVGLNAGAKGKGIAAASDEEYMKAAANTLQKAQWGMFFIPGIGRHDDLDLAAEYGMDFVRIGTNANEVEQAAKYVEHAKKLGMSVSANLMKSYIYKPVDLAKQARMSQSYGVDVISLVDSAGTMLPEDVKQYILEMKSSLDIPVGLHCHDNLSLGIANCLAAIKAGAQRLDTTLQGMGRGGGNPATEILLTVLKKMGMDMGIDPNRVMDISQKLIRPLLREKGLDTIDIVSGYAGFHSSYLGTILKYSRECDVDPRVLIEEVCKEDQVEASDDLVRKVANSLQSHGCGAARMQMVSLPRLTFSGQVTDQSKETMTEVLQKVARKAANTAKKKAKHSVLNIVAPMRPGNELTVSRFIQEDFGFVVASVELDSERYLPDIIKSADGVVDIFLVDCDVKDYAAESLYSKISRHVQISRLVGYRDCEVWTRAVEHEIRCILGDVNELPILLCGSDRLSITLGHALAEQGARITFLDGDRGRLLPFSNQYNLFHWLKNPFIISDIPREAARGMKAIISFSRCSPVIVQEMIAAMDPEGIVFDAGIGGLSPESLTLCNQLGIRVIRPDMRAALASELASLLGAERIVKELMGRKEIAGVLVVAGGLLGVRGEVVVDSISNPTKVIGIADGRGFLVEDDAQNEEEKSKIMTVNNEILRQLIF